MGFSPASLLLRLRAEGCELMLNVSRGIRVRTMVVIDVDFGSASASVWRFAVAPDSRRSVVGALFTKVFASIGDVGDRGCRSRQSYVLDFVDR